jgi:hypothetical protein
LYLNEEYEGGNIYFPELAIEHRPSQGTLILFLSEFSHGVRAIIGGARFCVVAFAENDLAYKTF